jgi:hypothetical protein
MPDSTTVQLILDPVNATATFKGLDEHIRTVAIPIDQITAINNELSLLDSRLDALEVPPAPKTYTVSFQAAP